MRNGRFHIGIGCNFGGSPNRIFEVGAEKYVFWEGLVLVRIDTPSGAFCSPNKEVEADVFF